MVTRRILVIDDESGVRSGLDRLFRREGFEVTMAENGRQALRTIIAEPPDLVVTDINMPEMDGIEFILSLRRAEIDVPVIAMSAGGRLDKQLLLDSAGDLGAIATIAKPFELVELVALVRSTLAGWTPGGDSTP